MVTQILELLAAGKSFQDILTDYFPDITVEDIKAYLHFTNPPGPSRAVRLL